MKDVIIKDIYKNYGEKPVLTGLSLTLPLGRCTALMGPSGCGKTTLANILMGIVKSDGGSMENLPERISTVFQEDRLIECLTPLANIRFAVGRGIADERMTECLSELGLEDISRPVSKLSGGMKRRVAIARALLVPFDMLVLDEPFKGLDYATRAIVAQSILRRSEGKTILFITHSREEAALMGARLIDMQSIN